MAFLAKYEATVTLGSGVSSSTVSVGTFSVADIAAFSVSTQADTSATTPEDACVTVEPLPGTGEITVSRQGTTGSVIVDVMFITDDEAEAQHFNSTSIGNGNNDFSMTSVVDLTEAYVISLGMSTDAANLDDECSVALTMTSVTNARAYTEGTPGIHELNFLVVRFPGATTQQVTQASNTPASITITAVDLDQTLHWSTQIPDAAATSWDHEETNTFSLLSTTNLQAFNFTFAGTVVQRDAHVVEFPANTFDSVQRDVDREFSPSASRTWTITSADTDFSFLVGSGWNAQGMYTSDSVAQDTNQEEVSWILRQNSATELEHSRNSSVTSPTSRISYEIAVWAAPPAGEIDGTAAGTSTVTGTLAGLGELDGTATGTAADVATLEGVGELQGTIAGTAADAATLQAVGALDGTATGTAADTATLQGTGSIAGSIAGTASDVATLQGTGSIDGTAAGTSTATATGVSLALGDGTAAGVATPTGTLQGVGQLQGTIAGTAADASTLQGIGQLQGTSVGTSTATATAISDGAISGAIPGEATTTGTLQGTGTLDGEIPGTSSDVATLQGTGALAGTSVGTSTATATAAAPGQVAGTAAGTSTVAGTLQGTGALDGTAVSTAADVASLTGTGTLQGTAAGTSTATATAVLPGQIAGTATGTAADAATLQGTGELSGTAAGTSTTVATAATVGELSGTVAAAAIVQGTLVGAGELSGVVVGASAEVGTLVGSAGLAGTSEGTTTDVATLFGVGALSGTIAGTSTATVGESGFAEGEAAGTSTATGTLTGQTSMAGTARGTSSVLADLVYQVTNAANFIFGSTLGTTWPAAPAQKLPDKDARYYALNALRTFISLLIFHRTNAPGERPIPFVVPKGSIMTEQPDDLRSAPMPGIAFLPGRVSHDTFGLGPPVAIEGTEDLHGDGTVLVRGGEHIETIILELWGSKIAERRALLAGLKVALRSDDGSTSIRLKLPEYYDQVVSFSLVDSQNIDGDEVSRNRRRAHIFLEMSVCEVFLVNTTTFEPTVDCQILDGNVNPALDC